LEDGRPSQDGSKYKKAQLFNLSPKRSDNPIQILNETQFKELINFDKKKKL